MTYPNAYSGVKKIFLAQILILIAAVLSVVVAGTGISEVQNSTSAQIGTGTLVAAGGISIVIAVISIVAFIINLVGLSQAGKDERNFKTAFILTIIGLIIAIVSGFASASGFADIFELAGKIINMLIIVFVIYGVVALATKLNDEKLVRKGKSLLVMITVLLLISVVMGVIGSIAGDHTGDGAKIAIAAVALVASIAAIVAYIMYLTLLARAKKTLKQ
ncbi:MAG: hypothetical protein IKS63_04625 [Firmicutes bacterium]|nr:hypothetical protein [Bacillota bacterium]